MARKFAIFQALASDEAILGRLFIDSSYIKAYRTAGILKSVDLAQLATVQHLADVADG